jgi:hypothetical protein
MDYIDSGILLVLVWTTDQEPHSEPQLEIRLRIQDLHLTGYDQIVSIRINSELTVPVKLLRSFTGRKIVIGSANLTRREYRVLLSELDISKKPFEIIRRFNLKVESTN